MGGLDVTVVLIGLGLSDHSGIGRKVIDLVVPMPWRIDVARRHRPFVHTREFKRPRAAPSAVSAEKRSPPCALVQELASPSPNLIYMFGVNGDSKDVARTEMNSGSFLAFTSGLVVTRLPRVNST